MDTQPGWDKGITGGYKVEGNDEPAKAMALNEKAKFIFSP
jgi:hypothetical protein